MYRYSFLSVAAVAVISGGFYFFTSSHDGDGPSAAGPIATTSVGAVLYQDHCAACHGVNLEGEPNWRRPKDSGRLPAPPHDETGHTWHHPDAVLFAITKYGTERVVGGDYRSDMIGFGDVLSDAEIIAVLEYIKSAWPAEIQARQAEIDAASRRTNQGG